MKKEPFLWVAILLLLMGSTAFQVREKGRKPGPDWSRSVPLGVFVRGDIDMAVDPDGRLVHLVYLREGEGRNRVHYMQLDEKGVPQLSLDLDLPDDQLRNPQIVPDGRGGHHLLWLGRPDGRRQWDLQHVPIGADGALANEIRQLAPTEADVGQFAQVADGQGGLFVAWESQAESALYASQLAADGTLLRDGLPVVDEGVRPALAFDGEQLYMTWMDEFEVMYTAWPGGDLAVTNGVAVESIPLNPGKDIDGPHVTVAGEWVYIIWSTFNSSGLEAGSAATEYIAFPKDSPQRSNAQRLRIAVAEEPAYAPVESAYQITRLAAPQEGSGSTDYVHEPNLAASRDDELAVAVSLKQDFRLDTITQIGVALFKEGQFAGYQMAGKTESFSQEPVLASDDQGHLYAAWREGGQGSVAFYAVTSAEGRSEIDRFKISDLTSVALTGGLEVLVGVLFFPLACLWLFPGLFLIGLWHFWRGDSDLQNKGTIVVLVAAVIVSQITKIFFLPTITTYVPFSAWFDIGPSWEQLLLYLVPVLIFLLSLLFAILMHRRTRSGLAFFFWFMAADAVLTLAIYGVTILGVF